MTHQQTPGSLLDSNGDPIPISLLAAAYTSYDKHFGGSAIEAAEKDVLGVLLKLALDVYNEHDDECSCWNCQTLWPIIEMSINKGKVHAE